MENKIVNTDKKDMVRGVVFDTDIYDHFEAGINSILKDSYNTNFNKDIKDYIWHTQVLADSEVYNYVILRLNTIKYNIIYSIKSIIANLLKTNIESLNIDPNLGHGYGGYNNINTILREYVETVISVKDKREVTERFVTAFYSYINVRYVAEIYSDIMDAARIYIYSNPGNIDLIDENPINTSLDTSYVYIHNIVSNLIHHKFEEYSNEFTAITEYIINAYSNIYVGKDQNNDVHQIGFDEF